MKREEVEKIQSVWSFGEPGLPNDSYADVPVSHPYFFPDEEVVDFDGFAWTQDKGIVVGSPNRAGEDWGRRE